MQAPIEDFPRAKYKPEYGVVQGRVFIILVSFGVARDCTAHPSPAYVARDYSRLWLSLDTDQITPFVFPQGRSKTDFPIQAMQLSLACRHSDLLEAG